MVGSATVNCNIDFLDGFFVNDGRTFANAVPGTDEFVRTILYVM